MRDLLIEAWFYRFSFFKILCISKKALSFISDKRQWIITKKLPKQGALSKAINLIAGEVLSSRAHFLFRFMIQK
jgi:hypothetical protein